MVKTTVKTNYDGRWSSFQEDPIQVIDVANKCSSNFTFKKSITRNGQYTQTTERQKTQVKDVYRAKPSDLRIKL